MSTAPSPLTIRDAVPGDAAAACDVLRRSIRQLCGADHADDPVILAAWLANKTPAVVASWIARADQAMLLAVAEGMVVGVGAVTTAGEITLNYVLPEARFRGVSRAMLRALEGRAAAAGNRQCHLRSTVTAHRFYREAGYGEAGRTTGDFDTHSGIPMARRLAAVPGHSGP